MEILGFSLIPKNHFLSNLHFQTLFQVEILSINTLFIKKLFLGVKENPRKCSLFEAVKNHDLETIRRQPLPEGASLDVRDEHGNTPLMVAVICGFNQYVETKDVETKDDVWDDVGPNYKFIEPELDTINRLIEWGAPID